MKKRAPQCPCGTPHDRFLDFVACNQIMGDHGITWRQSLSGHSPSGVPDSSDETIHWIAQLLEDQPWRPHTDGRTEEQVQAANAYLREQRRQRDAGEQGPRFRIHYNAQEIAGKGGNTPPIASHPHYAQTVGALRDGRMLATSALNDLHKHQTEETRDAQRRVTIENDASREERRQQEFDEQWARELSEQDHYDRAWAEAYAVVDEEEQREQRERERRDEQTWDQGWEIESRPRSAWDESPGNRRYQETGDRRPSYWQSRDENRQQGGDHDGWHGSQRGRRYDAAHFAERDRKKAEEIRDRRERHPDPYTEFPRSAPRDRWNTSASASSSSHWEARDQDFDRSQRDFNPAAYHDDIGNRKFDNGDYEDGFDWYGKVILKNLHGRRIWSGENYDK